MAQPGRQEILVIAGMAQQEHAHIVDQIPVRANIKIEIAAHAAACEHADRSGKILRRMASVFQCFPSDLQKLAVLRVHDGGFFGERPKNSASNSSNRSSGAANGT